MIFIGNLMIGVATVLDGLLNLVFVIVIVSVIISWLRVNPSNPIVQHINLLSESIYSYPRKYMKTTFGSLDIAPIIVIFGIIFVRIVLIGSLSEYGYTIKARSMGASLPVLNQPLKSSGRQI